MSAITISLNDIRDLLNRNVPLHIIDVRAPAEFSTVHALGATSIPLDSLNPQAAEALRSDSTKPLYMICHSGARAAKAWQQLTDAGVSNLCCIEGGTTAWERAGLPIHRGQRRIISMERQVRITAGFVVLLGVLLGFFVHRGFNALSGFVGAGLMFAGITDSCGMARMLAMMPWNRARPA